MNVHGVHWTGHHLNINQFVVEPFKRCVSFPRRTLTERSYVFSNCLYSRKKSGSMITEVITNFVCFGTLNGSKERGTFYP